MQECWGGNVISYMYICLLLCLSILKYIILRQILMYDNRVILGVMKSQIQRSDDSGIYENGWKWVLLKENKNKSVMFYLIFGSLKELENKSLRTPKEQFSEGSGQPSLLEFDL